MAPNRKCGSDTENVALTKKMRLHISNVAKTDKMWLPQIKCAYDRENVAPHRKCGSDRENVVPIENMWLHIEIVAPT